MWFQDDGINCECAVLVLISCVVSTLNRLKPAIPDRIGYISKSTSEFLWDPSNVLKDTLYLLSCTADRTKPKKNAYICQVKLYSDSVKIIWRFSFNCFWMCFTVISIYGFLAFPEKEKRRRRRRKRRNIWISAIQIFFEMKTRKHKTIEHFVTQYLQTLQK